MKRSILFIVLGLIAWAAFAEDELEFYTNQLNNALTAGEQLNVLRIVRDAEIDDAASFYAAALKRVLWLYPNIKGNKELDAADESIILITHQLESEDQVDTGPDLWRVVQTFSNPRVRAEALISLGKVGASDLLPQVVQLLKDTNSSPYINRLSGERIAFGAIDALANYKDPAGYLPVFFAANGWYSGWVKERANDALADILDDPTEELIKAIHSPGYTYAEKHLALKTIEKSEADESAKADAAVAALYEGWKGKGSTNDRAMQKELVQMRKLAIKMLGEYGTEDESVYPLLDRSYLYAVDEEEQLGVIIALKNLATEDAATLLSNYIALINNKLERGIMTSHDERLMRTLVPALGETGNAVGQPVLRQVAILDWSYGIRQIAQDALDNLGE